MRGRGVPEAHRLEHPAVASTLQGSDIVCLQEVFLGEACELFDRLAHPHKWRDENRTMWRPLSFGGSGLAVASRHPFGATALRAFEGPNVGAERFARKGMLHARVQVDGALVDIVTTHLQSGYGDRAETVRARQMDQLREWVDEVGAPERPMIVCGDLNVDGRETARDAEYATLRRLFAGYHDVGAKTDLVTFYPHPDHNALAHRYEPGRQAQRLDYILVRSSARSRVASAERVLERRLDGAATHASDHFGLRATLTLSGPGPGRTMAGAVYAGSNE